MDDSTKLRRTAIHESAHALCCASQLFRQGDGERIPGGVFLTIISILPTDETWGHYNLWPKTDDIRTLNSIDMAGATATYLSTGSMRNVLYEGRGDADFVAERMKVRAGDILCAWGSLLTCESSPFALTEWYEVLKDSFQLSSTIVENRWHARRLSLNGLASERCAEAGCSIRLQVHHNARRMTRTSGRWRARPSLWRKTSRLALHTSSVAVELQPVVSPLVHVQDTQRR